LINQIHTMEVEAVVDIFQVVRRLAQVEVPVEGE
jgi:hypothetical protein